MVGLIAADGVRAAYQQTPSTQVTIAESKLSLSFEENWGQTDPPVRFLSRGPGYSLFLTPEAAVLTLSGREEKPSAPAKPAGPKSPLHAQAPAATRNAVLRMALAGGQPPRAMLGRDPLPGVANYFRGNDPARWRTGIPTYGKVEQRGVYPGIDLTFYGSPQQLEYDFIVAPGADPKAPG